eukprot:TRINITY_DN80060_c0_g1_i1.p1 TRINITY_DN80060_c0_g1~~TRINITY_DN80060_c0_g1_i1.p1  ORF type:complete len:859 (-),score=143.81 TRINITY_DN80060_c0_g1_i1:143-2719(-)
MVVGLGARLTRDVDLPQLLHLLKSLLPLEVDLCMKLIDALMEDEVLQQANIDCEPRELVRVFRSFVKAERMVLKEDQIENENVNPEEVNEDHGSGLRHLEEEIKSMPCLSFLQGRGSVSSRMSLLDLDGPSPGGRKTRVRKTERPKLLGVTGEVEETEEEDDFELGWFPPADLGGPGRRLFETFEDANSSKMGKFVMVTLMVTLGVSTITFVMESMPEFRYRPDDCEALRAAGKTLTASACEPRPVAEFWGVEAICIAIFTIDYVVRVLTVHTSDEVRGRGPVSRTILYLQQPLNVIDFLAIMPFYVDLVISSTGADSSDLSFMRLLRLARILRLFKIAKHHAGFAMFMQVLKLSGQPLAILAFFIVIITILFGSLMFYAEGQRFSVAAEFTQPAAEGGHAAHPTGVFVRTDASLTTDVVSPFRSIPYCCWWVAVTTTTVGYGDIAPTTPIGKFIGVTCFYVGVIFLALPVSVLGSNFEVVYNDMLEQGMITGARKVPTKNSAGKTRTTISMGIMPAWPVGFSPAQKVFRILDDPQASRWSKRYSLFMLFMILLSTTAFIVESIPDFNKTPTACATKLTVDNCKPEPQQIFVILEAVSIAIFTIDYVLRLGTVHSATNVECEILPADATSFQKIRCYATNWLNIVDVLALVPFYIQAIFGGGGGASVLRVLRLVRVFRIIKMPKLRACVDMFSSVMLDAMPALILLVFMTSLMCVLLGSCMYFAEGAVYSVEHTSDENPYGTYIRPTVDGYAVEPTPFTSIMYTFWWFFTTATTVGYGDDFPTSTTGRIVGVATFYTGIVLLALPVTIVSSSFSKFYPQFVEDFQQIQGEASTGGDDVVCCCIPLGKADEGGGDIDKE